VLAQVGSQLNINVVHVNVDDLQKGGAKQYAPLMQSRSIPYTVLVDAKLKPVKTWNGGHDAAEFARDVKANMK
jgi:hypothetical protein